MKGPLFGAHPRWRSSADRIFTMFTRYQIARVGWAMAGVITAAQRSFKVFVLAGLLNREGYAGRDGALARITVDKYWSLKLARSRCAVD